jgi:protease-4
MKEFLKYTLATIVGIVITSILFFLFLMALVGAVISSGEKPVSIRSNSVLKLNIGQTIPDRSVTNPFEEFDPITLKFGTITGLNDILRNIKKAKDDPDIKGIFVEVGTLSPGFATIEELRNALTDFKTSGKFILAYSDEYFPQSAYYLATVCDKIYASPVGVFEFFGLRSEIMFYKDALEKLGVEMQVIRHGKFKSAVEPYIMNKMSDENRDQILTFVSSIWNHLLTGIAQKRNISIDELNRIADQLLIKSTQSALEYKLLDGIKYYDEVLAELKDLSGLQGNSEVRFVSQEKYRKVEVPSSSRGTAKNKIAVLYASGEIEMPFSTEPGIDGAKFSAVVREARLDSTIKAIVIRVNSPGGSVIASDMIWREVDLTRHIKPVVASMGNVAASGGYYIVASADTIVASPVTITGSIGVFGLIPNASKLLNQKLGISFDVAKTNKFSDFLSIYRPLRPEERDYLQNNIETTYSDFVNKVSNGRHMRWARVDSIGQGRVWSGAHALTNGLIDTFGGLNDAIRIAAEMAGIQQYSVKELPKPVDPYQQLIKDLSGDVRMHFIKKELGPEYKLYENLRTILEMDRIQARLPYFIDIY